jgi:glycosyltransferase involved in cell wall biosynthesis
MKKVLLVTHYFPPHCSMGAQRPYKLAKYLPKFGWQPIILTAKYPGRSSYEMDIIETENKDVISQLKSMIGLDQDKGLHEQLGITESKNYNYSSWKSRLIKLLREVIAYPDDQRGWYKYAFDAASKYLSKESVDAIISSSFPVTSHLVARQLKQKFKIPWIADLRDIWTQNPYVNKFGVIKYFERRLEIKTLSDADVIVTVTEPWINMLQELHKNKKVICITNGYDQDDFPDLSIKLTNKFTITYTGILYNGKRDPSMLFEVVAQLINENKIDKKLIEIKFYGHEERWFIDEVNKYSLEDVVKWYGHVPRIEALKRQKESQLLLLLLWNSKMEHGFCPGKIYEYFGARRPIIAIGGRSNSMIKNLLETTNTGQFADNRDSLKDIIYDYYMEFKNFGEIKNRSNAKVKEYTYHSIAQRYSKILNGLV